MAESTPVPLPGALRLEPTLPFVGRTRELATLRALLPHLEGEGRRAALIGGEAGSGKSRLVREFAREAAAQGACVLYGGCDAAVHTPYGPFVEAIDWLVRDLDTRDAAPRPRRTAAARSLGSCPTCASAWAGWRRRSPPTPTPSATGCTPRSPSCSPPLAAAARSSCCSRTATGPTPRRLQLLRHLARSPSDVRMLLRRDLPRCGGRRAGCAGRCARRPASGGGRRASAARRPHARGGR